MTTEYYDSMSDEEEQATRTSLGRPTSPTNEQVCEVTKHYSSDKPDSLTATPGEVVIVYTNFPTSEDEYGSHVYAEKRDERGTRGWIDHSFLKAIDDTLARFQRTDVLVPNPLISSMSSVSSSSSSSSSKKQRVMTGRNTNDTKRRRVATAEDEAYNKIDGWGGEEEGFDPEDVNKICYIGGFFVTPMIYFSGEGDLTMCRYVLSRGADCRKTDEYGGSPLYYAAAGGHLEIVQFLSNDGGAQDDIRKITRAGNSPLSMALDEGHFEVVYWLILNGALALRDDMDGGGIDDAIMRNGLRQGHEWREDRRRPILSWARDAVATHDNIVQLLVTGMIVRTNNQESSLLVTFKGTSGILELIARFVAGTQQQLRTQRQLMDRLSTLIDDTPFVEEDDWDDDSDDEEEDEEDY